MKKLIFGLVGLLCSQLASAQKELLQFDETNKYVYYQVIDKPGLTADTLYQRGLYFAKMFDPKNKANKAVAENSIVTSGKFLVYNGASVVKKEGGEITYVLSIDTKDQKYRYKISNLVFKPYKRDRFNNMTVQPGVEIPLETLSLKYSKKEADNYLAQAGAFSKATGDKLKQYMDRISLTKREDAVKKITTDKW